MQTKIDGTSAAFKVTRKIAKLSRDVKYTDLRFM